MPILQGFVGPQAGSNFVSVSGAQNVRLTNDGALVDAQLHGRSYESNYRGRVFSANANAQASTVTTNATFTGLGIFNPASSGVNVELLGFYAAASIAGVLGIVGLQYTNITATQTITSTTLITPVSMFIGGGSVSKIQAFSAATFAGVLLGPLISLGQANTNAVTTYTVPVQNGLNHDPQGSILVAPGGVLATYTLTANTASWTMVWQEVAI